jgi:ATP-binding cassette subfamily F protein 3
LTHYPGGYQYYLDKSAAASAQAGLTAGPVSLTKGKDQKRREAEDRQARYRERKGREETVAKLEAEILRLETRQKELAAELENPATYEKPGHAMALNRELMEVVDLLKSLAKEWEDAADKLSENG